MVYTHHSININGQEVKITNILSGEVTSSSEFETETFSFIQNWLQNVESYKLQTSGSTGTPKEIVLTRKQLQQSAQRTIKAFSLTENDIAFICLDTKYIAGKMMLVRAFESNMKILAVEPSSNPLQKVSSDTSNTFAAFVPLQLQEMLKHSGSIKKLNQFKAIIVGGGAVNSSLQNEIKKISCPVYATYGMTETISHIALQRLNGDEATENFTTLPGIQIEVDERNCLVISLPEFSEKIVTNDLADLKTASNFKWLGRFDNVINSGGIKISPEKIEEAVESIFQERSLNRPFFVYGIPDDQLGQKMVLLIEGFPISGEKKILAILKEQLHAYEVPKKIYHIREFIRTETGKINRAKTAALIS
jgi:O-succinylbenzoic acid--CoA ligase